MDNYIYNVKKDKKRGGKTNNKFNIFMNFMNIEWEHDRPYLRTDLTDSADRI